MKSTPPIELREITKHNFLECINLTVADDQRNFVASNMYSLAEAKADRARIPLAIYAGDVMVGFIMYLLDDTGETGEIERLMVGSQHQRCGYGRAAMLEVIDRLRNTPGCVRAITSFDPENAAADALHYSLGFRRTGLVVAGETEVALEFSEKP